MGTGDSFRRPIMWGGVGTDDSDRRPVMWGGDYYYYYGSLENVQYNYICYC